MGKRWDFDEGLYVVPAVTANFVHLRSSAAAPQIDAEQSDTANEFGGGISTTLGWNMVFVNAGVAATTVEGSDPVFSLGIGLVSR